MQSYPLISVILPFYNAEQTLNEAIHSIANQTYTHFECILVNNNSSDRSQEIAESWCSKDSRFRVIEEKQQGVTFASNSGSEEAQGKYIARMDADDIAFPTRLQRQCTFMESHPDYGAVAGLARYKAHHEKTEGFRRFVSWCNKQKDFREIYNRRFVDTTIINPTAMWRKETEDVYGSYRHGNFPEDYEMWLRWLHAGVMIGKVDEEVIQWNDSDERLTRTHALYSDEAFFGIKSYYLAKWINRHFPEQPEIWIWGASRTSRRHLNFLTENMLPVTGYIDTKTTRKLDAKILHYSKVRTLKNPLILVYMKHHEKREQIGTYLNQQGFTEGENYLFIS